MKTPGYPQTRVRRLAAVLLGLAALSASPLAIQAQNNYSWDNVAIGGGGYITGLVAHPTQSSLIYARTDVGGAYRWNGSDGWTPLFDWVADNNDNAFGINSLAIDTKNADVLYAASGKSIYNTGDILKSVNRGETWTSTNLPIPILGNGAARMTGERLAVDPNNSAVVYYGSNAGGLYRSTNATASSNSIVWSTRSGVPAGDDADENKKNWGVTFVAIDPRGGTTNGRSNIVYAGVYGSVGGGIYKSTNGGDNWIKLGGVNVPYPRQGKVAQDGTLYLTHDSGVAKIARTSTSVISIAPSESGAYNALAIDPTRSATQAQVIMVSRIDNWSGLSIFRSTNDGQNWTRLTSTSTQKVPWSTFAFAASTSSLLIDPSDPKRVWLGDWYAVWRTDDVTATTAAWTNYPKGHEEIVPFALTSPTSGAPLFSASADVGTLRHSSLTQFPTQRAETPYLDDNTSVEFCETDGNWLARVGGMRHGTGPGGGGYSINNGASWTAFAGNFGRNGKIAVGATKQANGFPILVVAPDGANMMRSLNGGATWLPTTGGPQTPIKGFWGVTKSVLAADKVNGNKFYVFKNETPAGQYTNGYGNLYVSIDGGNSWGKVAASGQTNTFTYEWGFDHTEGEVRTVPGREGEVWVTLHNSSYADNTSSGLWRITGAGTASPTITKISHVARYGPNPSKFSFDFGKPPAGSTTPPVYVLGTVKGVAGVFRSDNAVILGGSAASASWVQIYDHAIQRKALNNDAGCLVADRQVYGRVYVSTNGRGILVGQIQAAGPDLVVTDIQPVPANFAPGDSIRYAITVRNQGGAPTGPFWLGASVDVNGLYADWGGSYVNIAAGGTWTITTTDSSVAPSGTFQVSARADYPNYLTESDETNNRLQAPFSGTSPLPDLVVTAIAMSPADAPPGASVTFRVTIRNQGNASTGSSWLGTDVRVNGVFLAWGGSSVSLAPSATVTITTSSTSAPALGAVAEGSADYPNYIAESNETNNRATVTLR